VSTITIGIDAHKRSHTANAIDETEQVIDRGAHTRQRQSGRQATGLGARWPDRRWAVEGAAGTGRLLAQQLVAAGETVVDVPPTLAARTRLLDTGKHARTTTSTRPRLRSPGYAADSCVTSYRRTSRSCCVCWSTGGTSCVPCVPAPSTGCTGT
jgi:hypothetical protein